MWEGRDNGAIERDTRGRNGTQPSGPRPPLRRTACSWAYSVAARCSEVTSESSKSTLEPRRFGLASSPQMGLRDVIRQHGDKQ